MISFAEMGEATVTELKIRYFGIKERVKVAVSYLFLFIYVMSFLFLLPSFLLSFILFFSFFFVKTGSFSITTALVNYWVIIISHFIRSSYI